MKRAILHFLSVICFLFFSCESTLSAATFDVDFVVSRPHCILYLLESLRGEPHHSPHLKDLFQARRGEREEDARFIKEYRSLFEGSWRKLSLPSEGGRERSLADALEVIAVSSTTTDEFLRYSRVLFPAQKHIELCDIMHHFEPVYDELFWDECEEKIKEQLEEIKAKAREINFSARLTRTAGFMGSAWPEREGFVVALVPIPRKQGEHFTAFGHANGFLEVVEVPQHAEASLGLGIIAHEICHTLWSTRSDAAIEEVKGWFSHEGGHTAHQQLNEALATALGNGWIASLVLGKTPPGQWYNDSYVDGFGKGIFEIAREYCQASRRLDRDFVLSALSSFRKKFPGAEDDPFLFMRDILIVTNDKDAMNEEFRFRLTKYTPLHSMFGGIPIDNEKTRKKFSELSGITTLFLLHPDEMKLLEGFDLSPALVEELTACSKNGTPFLLKKKTPTRWLLFSVAPTPEEREKALYRLFDKKQGESRVFSE